MPSDSHSAITIAEPDPDALPARTVDVEFLVLDRETCQRCRTSGAALEDALAFLEEGFAAMDVAVSVQKIHVQTATQARRLGLEVSPTIRIDGQDIQPDFIASPCESAGEECLVPDGSNGPTPIDCREWRYRGDTHVTAPPGLLVEALVRAAVGASPVVPANPGTNGPGPIASRGGSTDHGARGTRVTNRDGLPANLRRYFEARTADTGRAAGEGDDGSDPCCGGSINTTGGPVDPAPAAGPAGVPGQGIDPVPPSVRPREGRAPGGGPSEEQSPGCVSDRDGARGNGPGVDRPRESGPEADRPRGSGPSEDRPDERRRRTASSLGTRGCEYPAGGRRSES